MKSTIYFVLFLFLFSCTNDEIQTSLQREEKKVSVQLSFPKNVYPSGTITRSNDVKQRIIVEVYRYGEDEGSDFTYKEKKTVLIDQISETITVDFTMQQNQKYRLLCWSDISNNLGKDLYYSTTNSLQTVSSILNEDNMFSEDPQKRDAFYAAVDVIVNDGDFNIPVKLSRACAVLKINATDLHSTAILNKATTTKLQISVPAVYDVNTGIMNSEMQNIEVHYPISQEIANNEVLSFYLLSPESYILNTFQTNYYDENNNLVINKEFSGIPVKRNTRTILTGNIFTSNVNVEIEFDESFENSEEDSDEIIRTIKYGANSYILHPSIKPVRYSIPINYQNIYWSRVDPSKVITESTKWKSKIIWSELSGGNYLQEERTIPMHFDFYVYPKMEGNMLIGIYNDENDNNIQDENEAYLWSYHLWITNYDPDQSISIISSKYDYSVSGGMVQRLRGEMWENPDYSTARIMDRNLGELSVDYLSNTAGALLFQYGRKDPFPRNLLGNGITTQISKDIPIQSSVASPTELYSINKGDKDNTLYQWTLDATTADFLWSDTHAASKSLFDPCPYGWTIATKADFTDLFQLTPNESANVISFDNLRFRKYGIVKSSDLTFSETNNYLYLLDVAVGAPNKPYCIDFKEKRTVAIQRATGLPIRCIKRD